MSDPLVRFSTVRPPPFDTTHVVVSHIDASR